MYPSKQKPYSGIFVKNQYEYLRYQLALDIDIFYMKRKYTNALGSILKYLFFYIRFIPLILKIFNVIHIHFFGFHFVLALMYKFFHRKTKIVVTLHGSDIGFLKKAKFLHKNFNNIDCLIAVSEYQNKLLQKNFSKSADHVLCAGVRKDIFYKLNETSKIYDFIFVGSFYKVKGIDLFIEAIKDIQHKMKICFVGSGPYLSEIENLQRNFESKKISLFKDLTQEEIMKLYNESKFLVLPSRNDSFGLVVTEALYCGTPVIASNTSGTKEQVEDKYNGFLINDLDELKDIMSKSMKLSQEEYKILSSNAVYSNQQYSLENVSNQLKEIYQNLIN